MEELKEQLERLKRETKEKSIRIAQRDSTFDTNSNCSATIPNKNCSVTATTAPTASIAMKNNCSVSTNPLKNSSVTAASNNKNQNLSIKNASQISSKISGGQVQSTTSSTTTINSSRRRISINNKYYTILNSIGKGGSSVVYQAFSDGDGICVAIKCVDLSNADSVIRKAYENEIKLLEKLQGSPHVIKMFDYQKTNNRLYVVLERGDIDLATFMQKRSEQIDDKFIKYHWQEMLRCVKVIHDRNIVHSDLKPANFLFVGASLKLIDFGIATNIPSNLTSAVKDIQIGTLNYMSPEAINGSYTNADGSTVYKIPLKSDVWSLGCILYAMVYGKTPFQAITNQIAKLTAIANESHKIEFAPIRDPLLLNVLKKCLVRNVRLRASVDDLLADPYLKE